MTSSSTETNVSSKTQATLNDFISDFFVYRFGKMSEIQQMRAIAYGRTYRRTQPGQMLSTASQTSTGSSPRPAHAQLMVYGPASSDPSRLITDVEILKTCVEKLVGLERTLQRDSDICDDICRYKQAYDECFEDSNATQRSLINILEVVIEVADREFVDLYGDTDIAHLLYLTERERRAYVKNNVSRAPRSEDMSEVIRELVEYCIEAEQSQWRSAA